MKIAAIKILLFSYLVYSSLLERISRRKPKRLIESTPFQFYNLQIGNITKFPKLSIQEIGEKACTSARFFRNYKLAITMALDFICLKTENSDSKKHQEILLSNTRWQNLIAPFNSPLNWLLHPIFNLRNILKEKDLTNIDFYNDSKYNGFCESLKDGFEQLKLLNELEQIGDPWLNSVKKEFNIFIMDASPFYKSFKEKIEKEVNRSGPVSDEDVKSRFQGVRLSSLYKLFDEKEQECISNLNYFRGIFCALYQIVPIFSWQREVFFQNNQALIDSFDKIYWEDRKSANYKRNFEDIINNTMSILSITNQTKLDPMQNYYLVYDFYSFDILEFKNLLDFLISQFFELFLNHRFIVQEYLYRLKPFLNKEKKK